MIKNAQKPASSEPAKTTTRVIRSIGPKNPSDGAGKKTIQASVIIKKAGSTTGSANASGVSPAAGARSTKGGSIPAKKNGIGGPNGDLRSVIAENNTQRGLISAQNLPFLRRFVTEQGKILSRRLTRVTARQQREITKAIKQARILGYLQFVNTK